jgi:toxin ParE1/3/4
VRLRILVEAEEEAQQAARWYEERQGGLGQDFLNALSGALQAIEQEPQRFAPVETIRSRREVRQYLLERFSYAVIYEVRVEEVLVLAVAHVRRRPNYWKRRRG